MAPPPRNGRPIVGPYMLQELVNDSDLPLDGDRQGVTITCLEAWASNLYVGTSAHEILHLVSIPPTPNPSSDEPAKPQYILASRNPAPTPPAGAGSPYIKQILLLPTVLRALVLSSSGLLSFYTLPEFSPALPGTKLKDVTYIGGLDLSEDPQDIPEDDRKLVMILNKNKIRKIRIGEDARLVKDIPIPGALNVMRRGTIACVATNEKYALLDIENMQQMPLFPLTSTADDPTPAPGPAQPQSSIPRQPSPTTTSSGSASGSGTPSHPPRVSSLTSGRERRNSSAAASKEANTQASHNRSVSAGNVTRTSGQAERGGPARRGSTRGGTSRPSSRQSLLPPPDNNRAPSPRLSTSSSQRSSSGRGSPASPASPTKPRTLPLPSPSKIPTAPRGTLKPHIASPTPNEFLLTTGTRPEDPGVGLFVDMNGDVTRGTIEFERYPDQVLVQDGWVIATIPQSGLMMHKWDVDESAIEDPNNKGKIPLDNKVQLKEVLELDDTPVAGIGRTLRLVHLPLRAGILDEKSELPGDARRNEEERVIAERISKVESRLLIFEGRKVWSLLQSPLVLRLDSRLPNFSDQNFDGIVSRIKGVLQVLAEVNSIEPTTERTFHEVSFIKQKCGLLVLGELLRITSRQTSDISAKEIIRVEEALLESALDPRFIVALFGDTFLDDVVEGDKGVWVYGGISQVFHGLKSSGEVGNAFTRDVLMLLKRYLVSWREKRGFGSVGDEKEIFSTVDSALLRVMLMLDSSKYLVEKGKTVVSEGNVRNELYRLVESGLENRERTIEVLESFGRLYVLSILYSASKQYKDVLKTWRRILEEGDEAGEFVDGEERIKNYLLRLRDPDTVEKYGQWLASRNPKLGIQVFADENAKVKFEPRKILQILREHAPDAVRSYVEYLVVTKKNTEYANELIFLYLDDLVDTLENNESAIDRLKLSYASYCALESPKPTYHEFIVENSPPSDEDAWWHNRMRLLDLLGGGSGYEVAKVFEIVKKYEDLLVPEMVILYGREGKHAEALSMLTHGLNDFDTAINYCLFGGMSIFQTSTMITDREEQKQLFKILLDEFLKLKDLSMRVQQTSILLKVFGSWLDVTHVLSVIPDSWSIEILSGFLIGALRQLVREKAEVGIEKSLGRYKNLKTHAEYISKYDEIGPTIERAN
ncbi:hypothetical protein EDC01DRAFT_647017 [Geopyxis carbonaria]|nr:hypothetical protein EDC01DRAFT_647017 [Geopyxis carbonaria]